MEGTDIDVRRGGGADGRIVVGDARDRHGVGREDRVGERVGQCDRAQHHPDRAAVGAGDHRIGQADHEGRVVGESRDQIGEASRAGDPASVGEGGSEILRVGRSSTGVRGGQGPRAEGVTHVDRGQGDVGGDRAGRDRVAGSGVGDHVGAERDRGIRVDHCEGGRPRRHAAIRHRKGEADVARSSGCQ